MKETYFKTLYHDYFSLVRHVCHSYLSDESLAMDTAQEVYVAAWNNLDKFISGREKGLLVTIAKNKCLNILRRRCIDLKYSEHSQYNEKVNLINLTALEYSADTTYCKDIETIISRELKKLPVEFANTFRMRIYQGLPNREIAEIEGVSVRTIEYRLRRINTILEKQLTDYTVK